MNYSETKDFRASCFIDKLAYFYDGCFRQLNLHRLFGSRSPYGTDITTWFSLLCLISRRFNFMQFILETKDFQVFLQKEI